MIFSFSLGSTCTFLTPYEPVANISSTTAGLGRGAFGGIGMKGMIPGFGGTPTGGGPGVVPPPLTAVKAAPAFVE